MTLPFRSFSSDTFLARHGPWLGATAVLLLLVTGFFWKVLVTDRVLAGYDLSTYFYPYRQYAATALQQGNVPLWNPYLFQGVPFLANQQTAVLYPPNLLYLLVSTEQGLALSIALHLVWGAVGAYVYTRQVTRLVWLAAIGAAATFGLSGFLGAQVGHVNQVNAAVWLPWALLAAHRLYAGLSLRWTVGLSLILALQFLAGHAQPSYMTLAAVMLYWLGRAAWDWLGVAALRPRFLVTAGAVAAKDTSFRQSSGGSAPTAPSWFNACTDWYSRLVWRPVAALDSTGLRFRCHGAPGGAANPTYAPAYASLDPPGRLEL